MTNETAATIAPAKRAMTRDDALAIVADFHEEKFQPWQKLHCAAVRQALGHFADHDEYFVDPLWMRGRFQKFAADFDRHLGRIERVLASPEKATVDDLAQWEKSFSEVEIALASTSGYVAGAYERQPANFKETMIEPMEYLETASNSWGGLSKAQIRLRLKDALKLLGSRETPPVTHVQKMATRISKPEHALGIMADFRDRVTQWHDTYTLSLEAAAASVEQTFAQFNNSTMRDIAWNVGYQGTRLRESIANMESILGIGQDRLPEISPANAQSLRQSLTYIQSSLTAINAYFLMAREQGAPAADDRFLDQMELVTASSDRWRELLANARRTLWLDDALDCLEEKSVSPRGANSLL